MTIKAARFTPEVMLSAPRRSAGVPNSTGTKVLFTVTTYSFTQHKKTSQIRVLDVASGLSDLVVEDLNASEPTWISGTEFLYLKGGEKGSTRLLVDDVIRLGSAVQTIHSFDGGISNIKVKSLPDGSIALACSGLATPQGTLANPETEEKPHSTAKVYSSLFVRHWDAYVTENRNALWYGALQKGRDGKYSLSAPGLVNALAGTRLSSPVPPFGGTGDFDISPAGLVFVAKDPDLSPAQYTKTDLYFVPLSSFTEPRAPAPLRVSTPGLEGYVGSPVFSHSGRKVAFTRMRSKQYESDKPRLLLVAIPDSASTSTSTSTSTSSLAAATEFYATADGEGGWDRSPESIVWSGDDSRLFVTAEQDGRARAWSLPADPSRASELPAVVPTVDGSVGEIRLFGATGTKLFVTSSSLTDNSCYSVVDTTPAATTTPSPEVIISSSSHQGRTFGLSRSQVDSFWFPGGGKNCDGSDYRCQALVVRPSDFDASRRYPLCFLVHGGPQSAWLDGWSTRWNPAVFAEQGYVVVSPNPTGSTGYGMALQNGIHGNWGGRPYEDLVSCFEHVRANLPYVDAENAVALGASYGGFMINWIQGHPLGRKFKALVCHDGVFSTLNQWTTEELFFPIHDFEGTLWENRAGYEKWDPATHAASWATPQLIIHSELDYRLPISEGLAPFNVLQAKGIPSKMVVFPDENHWVLKPENSLVWHREVLGWINKYTGLDRSGAGSESLAAATEKVRIE